jgi:agmatinase
MSQEIPIGQGQGIQGRYGGLPDPYGSESFSQIVLLPVPFDRTSTYQKGSDKGPEALIEASRNMELYDIETNSEVYLKGIYTASPVLASTSEEMLNFTYKRTKELLNKDKFIVTIGGEHSISYAPIKALSEKYQNLTVLQFDAHADLQPAYENNPWSHASVMARVKELPNVKVVALGIRSMSKAEFSYINSSYTIFSHQIDESNTWLERVLDILKSPVYITFDLDVFDSSLMPSTGTPEPGGLSWALTLKILRKVFQEKNIIGFDVVELLPRASDPAPDYLAAKLIYKMLSYKFSL